MPVYTNDNGTTKSGWEINANVHSGLIDASSLSADRTLTLPDATGTFFLMEDTGINYNQLSEAGQPTFQSIKIMDSNNDHWANFDIGDDLTANRSFSITIGDANRSVHFGVDLNLDQDLNSSSNVTFGSVVAANFNGAIGATTPAAGTFTLIKAINAATQDAISLVSNSGGTGSFVGSLTTATLSGSRTYTFPNSTGTVVLGGGTCSGTSSGTNTGDQTNISGNAATVTTNANLTGPITSVGNATSIASQTGTGTTFAMSAGPTFTGTVTCADFATTGNSIIGDASTDTLTLNAAAWTIPNTIVVTKTAQASTAETLWQFKVSDSATTLSFTNNTSNASTYAPAIDAVAEQGTSGTAFAFNATKGDSGTTNANMLILARYNSGSGNTDVPAACPMLEIRNRATSGFYFTGGYNLQFLGGGTSPTVGSVSGGDIVTMCGFDRVNTRHAAAANRLLATLSERGSAVYLGDDAIDFAATTAYLTVNATDITFTSTTIAFPQKFTTYNNIATVSNGVPSELATIDLTGQTANIGATTVYAVPASGAGMYRVSALVVLTTAASVSSTLPNVQIIYTDNQTGGTVTIDATPVLGVAGLGQTGVLTGNTVGLTSTGIIPINAKASTNIQYQLVNYASSLAGMAYAVHLKLEAL